MKKGKLIKGRKICLKPIGKEDIEFLRQLRNRSENRKQFFSQDYIAKKMQAQWFEKYLKGDSDLMFIISDLEKQPQGCIAIYDIDKKEKQAQLGRLIIKRELRNKGYAKEAIHLLQKYSFNILNLKQIYLNFFVDNKRACDLYKKCGFREKRASRKKSKKSKSQRRIKLMTISKEEFSEAR